MKTCFETEIGGMPVQLKQSGVDSFTVVYFKQIKKDLNYEAAATELGACIMHALACESRLDNRTKAEARQERSR